MDPNGAIPTLGCDRDARTTALVELVLRGCEGSEDGFEVDDFVTAELTSGELLPA